MEEREEEEDEREIELNVFLVRRSRSEGMVGFGRVMRGGFEIVFDGGDEMVCAHGDESRGYECLVQNGGFCHESSQIDRFFCASIPLSIICAPITFSPCFSPNSFFSLFFIHATYLFLCHNTFYLSATS